MNNFFFDSLSGLIKKKEIILERSTKFNKRKFLGTTKQQTKEEENFKKSLKETNSVNDLQRTWKSEPIEGVFNVVVEKIHSEISLRKFCEKLFLLI